MTAAASSAFSAGCSPPAFSQAAHSLLSQAGNANLHLYASVVKMTFQNDLV